MKKQNSKTKRSFFTSTNFLFPLSILLGVWVGMTFPVFSINLGQLSDILLSLLKLCITPIILTTVVVGVFEVMSGSLRKKGWFLILAPVLFYVVSSSIGIGTGILSSFTTKDFDLSKSTELQDITRSASLIERRWDEPIESVTNQDVEQTISFINLVPDNIFNALDRDSIVKIIIFALIFGIALFYTTKPTQNALISVFHAAKETFEKLFSFISHTLPLLLFCIVAKHTKEIELESLLSMLHFIGFSALGFLILFVLSTFVISLWTRTSFFACISQLKEPIFLALASSTNMLTIPSATKAMKEKFHFNDKSTDTIIALGVFIAPYGQALYLSFATVFAASIYDVPLALGDYIYILSMSILMTISAAGSPALVLLSLIAFIFAPLGIPFGAFYALMVLVDFIISPMRTTMAFYPNCAYLALFAKAGSKSNKGKLT